MKLLLVFLVFLTLYDPVENRRCHYNVLAFFNRLRARLKQQLAQQRGNILVFNKTFLKNLYFSNGHEIFEALENYIVSKKKYE